jgi:hypothetical protein
LELEKHLKNVAKRKNSKWWLNSRRRRWKRFFFILKWWWGRCVLAVVAMRLWSQWLFQFPIQNIKKGSFLRNFGGLLDIFVWNVAGAFWSQSAPDVRLSPQCLCSLNKTYCREGFWTQYGPCIEIPIRDSFVVCRGVLLGVLWRVCDKALMIRPFFCIWRVVSVSIRTLNGFGQWSNKILLLRYNKKK